MQFAGLGLALAAVAGAAVVHALKAIRAHGRSTLCASHLTSLGIAMKAYAFLIRGVSLHGNAI